jgi:ankyrin repeat protein
VNFPLRFLISAVLAAAPATGAESGLIEAVLLGRIDTVRSLISTGADVNVIDRGQGSPLEIAERAGNAELADLLRKAGARSLGRSVSDKVCVRPWKGEGYCGIVEAIHGNAYRIRITEIVGCADGCAAMTKCSEDRIVGGSGLRAGDIVTTTNSCLTHTGLSK